MWCRFVIQSWARPEPIVNAVSSGIRKLRNVLGSLTLTPQLSTTTTIASTTRATSRVLSRRRRRESRWPCSGLE